jgi:hypothetical protein
LVNQVVSKSAKYQYNSAMLYQHTNIIQQCCINILKLCAAGHLSKTVFSPISIKHIQYTPIEISIFITIKQSPWSSTKYNLHPHLFDQRSELQADPFCPANSMKYL